MSDLFKNLQIPDISHLIDSDTTLILDADGIALKPATIIEERYIEAVFKSTGTAREFKNITEFKGKTKGDKVSENSWLGAQNLKRRVKDKEEFKLDDFEIIQKQRPKLSFEVCTRNIDAHITAVQERLGIEKVICLLGSGENHRHQLAMPEQYKANRLKQLRPLKLAEAREHITDFYDSQVITGLESDDWLSIYGFKGYKDYKKTGKFSYVVSSNDKDCYQTESLFFNWDREDGVWKHDNPILIPSFRESVGEMDLHKNKAIGTGLMMLAKQMLSGDLNDHFHPTKFLGMDTRFGDKKIFQALYPLETPQEVLQTVVDIYANWFPEGVKYTSWDGEYMEVTALEWANTIFKCLYMLRTPSDKTDFTKLLNMFEVDYEKLQTW